MYATSASDFQKLNVPVKVLNSICAEYDHPDNISCPLIRDNRIGVLIGTDAFIATVPLKFTTGQPGTSYGFLTQLRWTVTGPKLQKNKPTSKKGNQLQHHALQKNKKTKKNKEIEDDMLRKFWTMEGKILVSGKKTLSADDRKAIETKKDDAPQWFTLLTPLNNDTKLPNNYFLARAQLQSLENRLQLEPDLFFRYKQTIEADIEKRFVKEILSQFGNYHNRPLNIK